MCGPEMAQHEESSGVSLVQNVPRLPLPPNPLSQIMTEASHFAHFPTTHGSRGIAAGVLAAPDARAALADLCAACWYPIYALIRRRGHSPDEAPDLTQDDFNRLLEPGAPCGIPNLRPAPFRHGIRILANHRAALCYNRPVVSIVSTTGLTPRAAATLRECRRSIPTHRGPREASRCG